MHLLSKHLHTIHFLVIDVFVVAISYRICIASSEEMDAVAIIAQAMPMLTKRL